MKNKLKLGKYRHYKGGLYDVLMLAHHSETLEELVVYKALYKPKSFGKGSIWVRPLKMFKEKVIMDGKKVSRFKFLCK